MGTIGIAAIARSAAPTTATGFLCVAGIIDLRTFMRARRSRNGHDCLAYAVAALACALVAMRGGIALVNPKIAIALWPCAIVFAGLAYRYRMHACGALIYRATETTLADAFPGDRMDFTGILTRSESATTLVRYAITCSRADAAPIAVRLDSPSATVQRGWAHARGTLVQRSEGLRLRVDWIESTSAPTDPFVYR